MARPFVDGLERDLVGEVRLLRLDARGEAGQSFMRRYRVPFVPTFVLLDRKGEERLRVSGRVPDHAAVLAALR